MPWRCECCGEIGEPAWNDFWDPRPDGFFEKMAEPYCPFCGSADIYEIDPDHEEDEYEWLEEMAS